MLPRRIRPLAALVVPAVLIGGCATAGRPTTSAEPDCYAYIYFDGRYGIRGVAEASPEQARQGPCYRFTYDRDGQIARIDYRQGEQLLPDPVFGVATIRFQRSAGEETRSYLNARGEPTPDLQTMPVALSQMNLIYGIRWDLLSAAAALYIVPTMLMAVVLQRYIVRGLTTGSLKG